MRDHRPRQHEQPVLLADGVSPYGQRYRIVAIVDRLEDEKQHTHNRIILEWQGKDAMGNVTWNNSHDWSAEPHMCHPVANVQNAYLALALLQLASKLNLVGVAPTVEQVKPIP
jgi:hypothetical protein